MPPALWVLIGIAVFVLICGWWLRRRWRDVDSYFDQEPEEFPIVIDVTSYSQRSGPF